MGRPGERAMIKSIVAAAAAIAGVALWRPWADAGTHVGLLAGLGFGILLAPARLAGVDFRQWFRNPVTPTEISDDTFIGLIRSGFHMLWGSGLVALLALSITACHWAEYGCSSFGWVLVGAGRVGVGTIIGLAIVQVVVEVVWRYGLTFRLPPPQRTTDYLAKEPLPFLPVKQAVPGRRRLIVCCDGTWNWPEPYLETNVVRLVRALAPEAIVDGQSIPQFIHYHQGVGTGNFFDRIVGGGLGIGVSPSVKACYGFLVDNYRPGDDIFLFGFSRGAYVARSLGGMIGTLGLLRKEEMDRFSEAWSWYWQDRSQRKRETLDRIAPNRHRDVEIECVGVFDTVGALGIPGSRFCSDAFAFHETQLGAHVRHAFQALAMDEQRGNFQGAIWVPGGSSERSRENQQAGGPQQVLRQMWFPGVHSDVGGGYEKHGLSDTALIWMLSQVSGMLAFDQAAIQRCLDKKPEEFPVGTLNESRTLSWKLLGAPVPRPVCVVSETERVHESVGLRAEATTPRDRYNRPARREWTRMVQSLLAPRDPREVQVGGLERTRHTDHVVVKKRLDFCSKLVAALSARS
jgi:uncharacterized protein (DUF2235 family)